jgi:hypothetical protein
MMGFEGGMTKKESYQELVNPAADNSDNTFVSEQVY